MDDVATDVTYDVTSAPATRSRAKSTKVHSSQIIDRQFFSVLYRDVDVTALMTSHVDVTDDVIHDVTDDVTSAPDTRPRNIDEVRPHETTELESLTAVY